MKKFYTTNLSLPGNKKLQKNEMYLEYEEKKISQMVDTRVSENQFHIPRLKLIFNQNLFLCSHTGIYMCMCTHIEEGAEKF